MPPIMPVLNIQLLGEMKLSLGSTTLPIPHRIARRLLAYLSIEGGQHKRSDVAQQICPRQSLADARTQLRQAMFQIAKWYGRHPSPFVENRDRVEWKSSHPLLSDVQQIQAADAASFASLVEAINLIRGPLLANEETQTGSRFDHWLKQQRQRMEAQCTFLFESILRSKEAQDDFNLAKIWVERWMETEPLAEAPVAAAMHLFTAAGRIPEARYIYRCHEESVVIGKGRKPTADLQSLFAELTRHEKENTLGRQSTKNHDLSHKKWITVLAITAHGQKPCISLDEKVRQLELYYNLATKMSESDRACVHLSDDSDIEIIYGWRSSGEDGPLRALRAALAMRRQLSGQIGLGIHHGEVVSHRLPRPTGSVLQEAHRLARENYQRSGVLLSDMAYQLLPEVPQPDSAPTEAGSCQPSHWLDTEPVRQVKEDTFWGRSQELELIQKCAREVFHSEKGQAVWIVGDAGIGKTQLIARSSEKIPQHIPVARFSFQSIYQNTPLYPLAQLFQQWLGILEKTPEEGRQRVIDLLHKAREDDPVLQQLWLFWLGLETDERSAEAFQHYRHILQESILNIIKKFLLSGTHVTIIEDMQWADTSSLEILRKFLESLADRPILVIISSRNPSSAIQAKKCHSTIIHLHAWDEKTAVEYIRQRTHAAFDYETYQLLAHCSGGIPLYIDSLLRAFTIDQQTHDKKNLNAIIQSYIARSGDNLRLLQRAAIIQESFSHADIGNLCDDSRNVTSCLEELVRHGFLIEQNNQYTFRHEIIREATYSTINVQALYKLHSRWAEALLGKGHADPATLAHHYIAAGKKEAALHYLSQASRKALLLGAYQEAASYCEKALPLLSPGIPEEFAIRTDYYFALRVLLGYSAAAVIEAVQQLDNLCITHNESGWELLGARFGQWMASSSVGNMLLGLEKAQELANTLYTHIPQPAVQAVADYTIGWSHFWLGDLQCARKHLLAVIQNWSEIWAAEVMFATGERPLEAAMGYLGLIDLLEGKKTSGVSRFEAAIAHLSPEQHTNMWLFLQVMYATMGLWLNDSKHTLQKTPQILAISQKHGLLMWEIFSHALVAWSEGREGIIHSITAIHNLRNYIRQVESVWRFGAGVLYLLLADLAARTQHNQAHAILYHSRRYFRQHGAQVFLPTLQGISKLITSPSSR